MASPSPTLLHLPQTFPYPIRIISLDAQPSSSVERGTRLLGYSFVHLSRSAPDAKPETRFGTWDAAIEGTIEKWNVKVGDVISQRRAKEKHVLVINEPCKHGMQFNGLCVLCGKDMTNTDYTGFSDASRASIQMTHSAFGPTVSLEEAQRIERETADNLLKARKLSLIVDLDQTIVHATVDPTVGEWIAEGESWEARQANRAQSNKPSDDSDDDSSDSDDDECNPNWEALKDVKKFRLGPESFLPPSRGFQKGKGKAKAIESEGCMYYIKPRPGWKDFLESTATKYEMHVYTMGTRAYAEEVCAAIDPDGKIFGGRVLSRDESGSLTQKSLQRLFPCDTSMVVIIDDRADVWEWSPNLIKVIPYDFFVGIGDINSTFLPKIEPLAPSIPPLPDSSQTKSASPSNANESTPIGADSDKSPDANDNIPSATDLTIPEPSAESPAEETDLATTTMLQQNSLVLEAQLEERPLAKKQEALSEGEPPRQHHHHHHHHADESAGVQDDPVQVPVRSTTPEPPEKPARKALLKNDDFELQRVAKLLDIVHDGFFATYDTYSKNEAPNKPAKPPSDVTRIIPRLRSNVLQGVHLLFSSVIPLDTQPETTEIWKTAHMFGARCSTELTPDITHVVAAKRGTVKVDTARKRGGIKIVWVKWFTDCVAHWQRLDETQYLLDDPHAVGPTSSPVSDPHQISSDPEPDEDDWDREPAEPAKDSSLELGAIDWSEINAEVDEFLNETDDDEDPRSEGSVTRGNVSEDEGDGTASATSSVNNTPRINRKRMRSVTPSDGGGVNNDLLRSPLAKRKKIAAERSGASKLKDSISAHDLVDEKVLFRPSPKDEAMEEDDDDDEEEEEEEDDFLARELEEEWG